MLLRSMNYTFYIKRLNVPELLHTAYLYRRVYCRQSFSLCTTYHVIKMNLKEVGVSWWAHVNTVMNHRAQQNADYLLAS
jgi:hypothetical protein